MTSLSRSLGAHLGLLSMASSVMFTATPAAFAGSAVRNVNLNVTITEDFAFTVNGNNTETPYDVTLGTHTAGSSGTNTAAFNLRTNAAGGYSITIAGDKTFGGCSAIMCNTSASNDAMPDKAAFVAGNNGTVYIAEEGLSFRLLKSGTLPALYSDDVWGADDTTGALSAGIPTTAQTLISKGIPSGPSGDDFTVRFDVKVPAFQPTGTYQSDKPIVFSATTSG